METNPACPQSVRYVCVFYCNAQSWNLHSWNRFSALFMEVCLYNLSDSDSQLDLETIAHCFWSKRQSDEYIDEFQVKRKSNWLMPVLGGPHSLSLCLINRLACTAVYIHIDVGWTLAREDACSVVQQTDHHHIVIDLANPSVPTMCWSHCWLFVDTGCLQRVERPFGWSKSSAMCYFYIINFY